MVPAIKVRGDMSKIDRQPYLILSDIRTEYGNMILCHWCQFQEWTGCSCCDSELECQHPLEAINGDNSLNAWQGQDCWGFRPCYAQEDCVDIVGMLMQGIYPDWSTVPILHKQKRNG